MNMMYMVFVIVFVAVFGVAGLVFFFWLWKEAKEENEELNDRIDVYQKLVNRLERENTRRAMNEAQLNKKLDELHSGSPLENALGVLNGR